MPPKVLTPLIPRGTELDRFEGEALVSVVAVLFADTRVYGGGVRGHRVFEEVNLRFYVSRKGRDGAVEFGIDRFGGDYRSFDTPPDPSGAACKSACEGENRCRAWTYVRPGYLGPGSGARCYLKDRLRPPRRKPCCVSGVVR